MPISADLTLPDGTTRIRLTASTREQLMADAQEAERQFLRVQEARQFESQSIDTAPTGFESGFRMPLGFASEEARQEFMEGNDLLKAEAASQAGVDVTTGLPASLRSTAALIDFNPQTKARVLNELVRSTIPEVPESVQAVRIGPESGQPEYLRRDEESGQYRYTLVDPADSVSFGDVAEFAAELPQVALETLGAFGGALAGSFVAPGVGTAVGGTAGAVAGGQLGLDARVMIAEAVGVPQELIDDAVTDEVRFREAIFSAAGDLAGAVAIASGKGLQNFLNRPLNPSDFAKLQKEIDDNLVVIGDFQERFPGVEQNPTIRQLTDDADIQTAQLNVQRLARGDVAQDIEADRLRTSRAAGNALREMADQQTRSAPDAGRTVEEITEDSISGIRGGRQEAERANVEAQAQLQDFSEQLNNIARPETFTRVQEDAFVAAGEARKEATKAWDLYRKEAGYEQGVGSNLEFHSPSGSPIKEVLFRMDEEAGQALLRSTEQAQRKFVADAGLPEEGVTQGLAAEFLDPRQLHFTLSDLKRKLRQTERGVDPDGFRTQDIRDMIGAIEETIATAPMRYKRAGRAVPDERAARVRSAFERANDLTLASHSLFDNASMSALLERKTRIRDGEKVVEFEAPAGLIERDMFKPNDARFLSDALDSVGNNPAIRQGLAQEMEKKMRRSVLDDAGNFRVGAFNQFMDEHRDHMRLLFDEDQLAGIRSMASMDAAVKRSQAQLDQLNKELAANFGRRVGGDGLSDPINIAREMMDNMTPRQIRNVRDKLDEVDPVLGQEVRTAVMGNIRRKALDKNGNLKADALDQIIEERETSLGSLFGGEFVQNLRSVRDFQRLADRGRDARPTLAEAQAPIVRLTRLLFGPLGREQRFISAVNKAAREKRGKTALQIMTDPEQLSLFVKLGNMSPQRAAFWIGLNELGIGQMLSEAERAEGDRIIAREADRFGGMDRLLDSVTPNLGNPAPVAEQRVVRTTADAPKPQIEQLHRHEGFSGEFYNDSVGKSTIGFGRNVEANPITPRELQEMDTTMEEIRENGINREQAEILFANDYARAVQTAVRTPGWDNLNDARKDVIINMAFNLGPSRLRGFRKMMAALARGDYDAASAEMLDSKWAGQVGRRSRELAEQMRTGERQS